MESEHKISGFELSEGEACSICGCLAEEHSIDGCQVHSDCLNFYRYHDFEYLADDV
jgi:hypothetical protein